jgi:uncharacterized protein (TIGR02246 family)
MASKQEIEALCDRLSRAHAEKDAGAIVDCYATDAVIYDLAPPLGKRGMKRDAVAAWLATWEGPIRIDVADAELVVREDIAYSTALNRMRGRQGGEAQDIWFRATMCFRRVDGRWLITHDHTSVPFHMDGSYRAAVDLKP